MKGFKVAIHTKHAAERLGWPSNGIKMEVVCSSFCGHHASLFMGGAKLPEPESQTVVQLSLFFIPSRC
jgi:hypothetical protein